VNSIVLNLGMLPEISHGGQVVYEEGNVVLRRGQHKGVNRGFGAQHILAEHSKELVQLGYTDNEQGVINYVSAIFSEGADIFCDFDMKRNGYRPLVLKRSEGLLILETLVNSQGEYFYSVVTAYRTSNPKGVLVGKL